MPETAQSSLAREPAMRAYFRSASPPSAIDSGLIYFFSGVILLLVGITLASGAGMLTSGCSAVFGLPGGILCLWGAGTQWRARSRKKRRCSILAQAEMTDADAQSWIDDGLARAKDESLDALGVSDEDLVSDPLVITAPVMWSLEGVRPEDLLWRTGDDGQTRFAVVSVAVIALTEHHLGISKGIYHAVTDTLHCVSTCEYHYRDIVSVSTGEASASLVTPAGEQPITIQELRVAIPNGESIRLTVDVPALRRLAGVGALPVTGAEKAAMAIRTMLRQQKT